MAALPVDDPGYYSLGPPLENYESPVITFSLTEGEADAFVARCQTLTKWRIEKKRGRATNTARTQRNGVSRTLYMYSLVLIMMKFDRCEVLRVRQT
jgi:hypothetical protein